VEADREKQEAGSSKAKKLVAGLVGSLALGILLLLCFNRDGSANLLKQGSGQKQGSPSTTEISSYPMYENHPHDTFAQFLNFIATHGKD